MSEGYLMPFDSDSNENKDLDNKDNDVDNNREEQIEGLMIYWLFPDFSTWLTTDFNRRVDTQRFFKIQG